MIKPSLLAEKFGDEGNLYQIGYAIKYIFNVHAPMQVSHCTSQVLIDTKSRLIIYKIFFLVLLRGKIIK